MWEEVDPWLLALITPKRHCLKDPVTADHPAPAASPGAGNSVRIRAPGLQPIPPWWSLGVRDGHLAPRPLLSVRYLGTGLRSARGSPRCKNIGSALWAPAQASTMFPGQRSHPCAHLSPESPGAFGLVSCWLLAQHPPWYPACPSGQQPGSVHLAGADGRWGWWDSEFPEGGEEGF